MDTSKPRELSAAAVLESMGDGFVALDLDWCFIYANARGAEFQGRSAESLIGRNLFEVCPDAVGTSFESAYRTAMTERIPAHVEAYYPPLGRWFDQRVYPIADGIAVFFVDVTERRLATELSAGRRRILEMIAADVPLQSTLDALVRIVEAESPDLLGSILLLDDDGVHVRHCAAPSLPPEYCGAIDGQPIGPRAGSCGTAIYRREAVVVEDIETDPLWTDYRSIAGVYGLRACWSTPIFDPKRHVLGTFALYFRAPARPTGRHNHLIEMATHTASIAIVKAKGEQAQIRAQIALRNREAMFRSVFENAGIGMTMVSSDQQFTKTNPAFARMLGYTEEELLGRRIADVSHPDDVAENLSLYRSLVAGEIKHFQVDKRYLRKDRSIAWGRVTVTQVPQEGTTPPSTIGMIEDITARVRAEKRIAYLATHDELTHLPNRNVILDRVTQAIVHARRSGRQLAVLYLDLDRFKVINDGFGHPFGDAVLKLAGDRLAAIVRDGDTVARQGGDEFLILLSDLRKSTDVHIVAQKVLATLARPFSVDGREVYVTSSVGVSVYPQDGEVAEVLIGKADVAMYRAKGMGGNRYQFLTREMSDETQRRVDLETGLRVAIAHDQLQLAYQPKVDFATGRITGCEALLRWHHPELGVVSPALFIPIAEESGLIVPIGDWVLSTACTQNRLWQSAGLPPITVAVNLSARQFLQQDIVSWVTKTLGQTGLEPQYLDLELTESLIAQDTEKVIATVNRLKEAGVRLSIDDFGTGYSSLSYLKRYRVDTLKIDQSFVRNMLTEMDDASITLAVISLAHRLRMVAVAEGVETAEQCRFLRLNQCDGMQGYFFSRPVPAAELEAMLRSDKRLAATQAA